MLSRKILSSLELNILLVDRTTVGDWWNFKKVNTPFSRLYLVSGGLGYVHHHGQRYCLAPGVLHLVPCFCQADYFCNDQLDVFHMCLNARVKSGQDLFALQEYQYQREADPRDFHIFQRLLELNPGLGLSTYDPDRRQFRRREDLLTDRDSASGALESEGLLRLLLAPILGTGQPLKSPTTQGLQRFLAVFEFIEGHLAAPIRLDDLAKVAHMHKSYFAKLFHSLIGVAPIEYVTRRRVESSQLLLLLTNKTVKEIAFETGFSSCAAYCKCFHHICNQTPTQYRTMQSHHSEKHFSRL